MTMPTAAAPSSSSSTSRTVLFRRHRNRGGAGGDNDREVPVPMNHEEEEGVSYQNNVDNTQHEAFNNSVDEEVGTSPNRNLHPAIMTNYNSNSNNIPDEEDEEQQELVVQVPRRERRFVAPPPMATDLIDTNPHTTIANNQINHNNTAMPPSSPFGLPSLIGGWTHPSDEVLAIRREAIHREIERVQRSNFIHFILLCMIPTALLLIVIVAILSERGECGSSSTHSGGDGGTFSSSSLSGSSNIMIQCQREPRTFVNAFTSTCICNAIRVVMDEDADEEG